MGDEPIRMPIPGPYTRPAPTTMPGDGESRGLPVARVHGARARGWPIAALVFALLGAGALYSRTDRALDDAVIARAEAQRAYAHTAVLRVELEHVRATIPKPGAVDELCRRRTDALRSAVLALVRTGNASMVGDPSWSWLEWPTATSSPTTRSAEVR